MATKAKSTDVAMVEASKEVAPQEFSAEVLIAQAINKNVPVETMERLLAMRTQLKNEWAKSEFYKAMAAFQADCPVIDKTKPVKTNSGAVAYWYAPIESIVKQVAPILQRHGFSYATSMELKDAGVRVTVKVTHKDGHSEESPMEVPLGNKTNVMSQSQVVAAAQTFAKRYAFCNAFGILTGDEDTDASKDTVEVKNAPIAHTEPKKAIAEVTPKQKIAKLCKDLGIDLDEFAEDEIKKLTGLDVKYDTNYSEIISRLEIVLEQRRELAKANTTHNG